HADDARPPQTFQRPGDIRAVAVRRRLVVEEVADMGEEARMMGDGVLYGGAKRLAQTLAALVAALRRQAWQGWREMIVARDDDANGRRC
ncbi:MAG TPA: hypothetical protein VFQ32_12755, partial [Ktedonobacterales bacterium]|nr:hypothetical protein [Ktedonobacterales bacterium]